MTNQKLQEEDEEIRPIETKLKKETPDGVAAPHTDPSRDRAVLANRLVFRLQRSAKARRITTRWNP